MFTPENIRQRVRKQPFVPLRVETSSSATYDVYHPDMIWIGAREVHIGKPSSRKPEFFDQTVEVAIMHISAVEDLPQPNRTKGNGRGKD